MPTETIETSPARVPLEKLRADLAVFIGLTAKDAYAIPRGGVIGVITATGLIRRRSRATVTGTAFTDSTTTGTVDDASVFKAGDVITKADGTAIGTILSIAANTITLTGNAANGAATGVDVIATDGSAVAKGIADEGSDGSGDTPIRVCVGGFLDETICLRLTASAKTDLGGISLPGDIFKF